ncbi:ABC transporter ATP-binding protein [Desulfosporosinus sp. BICA1-9]|uniref:ATP-binding cassette domain-containing protein n=1 Tax=Desulfosporosinus sp. BICA1-9 TaxID=1531958 RepID=UPI0025BEF5AC|nr:ABC transporter ATP-binding protein [Desulfosporosinus sp. BICA1-9]
MDLAVDNPREPLLEVEGVVVRRAGIPVLQNVSFRLKPGEIMAVMGANGCGKTSLLLALLGHHQLEKGRVSYRGRDISHLDIQERVKEIGMILQNPGHQILERSVWQETLLAAEMLKPTRKFTVEAKNLLEEFSLLNYRNSSPFLLSMGEKKRLCAVSALVYEPDLLLLDEPLAGQDAGHLDLLMQHLYRHCEGGGSVLMVCHHPEVVASYCHRLLFLEGGQVGYEDRPDKVFQWLKERGKDAYLPLREGDRWEKK